MDRVEDILLHQKLLAMAKDPEKRPVYHIRFLEVKPFIWFNNNIWIIIFWLIKFASSSSGEPISFDAFVMHNEVFGEHRLI